MHDKHCMQNRLDNTSDTSDTSVTSDTSNTSFRHDTRNKSNTCDTSNNTSNACNTSSAVNESNASNANQASNVSNTSNASKSSAFLIDFRVILGQEKTGNSEKLKQVQDRAVAFATIIQIIDLSHQNLSHPLKVHVARSSMHARTIAVF